MKNLKLLFNTIIAAGAVILLGTAGFSDNSTAQLSEVADNVVVSLVMISVGLWGKYAISQANAHLRKMKRRYQSNLDAAMKMMKA